MNAPTEERLLGGTAVTVATLIFSSYYNMYGQETSKFGDHAWLAGILNI